MSSKGSVATSLAVGCFVCAVPLIQSPASASTCGSAGTWHDTFNTNSSSTGHTDFFGVRADIDVQQPKFCSGGASSEFSNLYVMTKDSTVTGWAQGGYERQPSNGGHPGIHYFAQTRGSGVTSTWYSSGTVSTGHSDAFRVENFDSAPLIHTVYVSVNNTVQLQGDTGNWATPFYMELSGEARYREEDIAGVDTNRANFSGLKYKVKSSGTWTDMPNGIWSQNSDSSRWHNNAVSATQKQLWTDPTN
ncbi:MAG: hypothetical protein JWO76_1998 [Nocardioides sp.]|nr:hypothetical protein [Nocardioides sp.]